MRPLSLQLLHELRVCDRGDSGLNGLYGTAIENLDLNITHYLTIRDLTAISGYREITVHGLLIAMFMALLEGSTCLFLTDNSLKKKLGRFTGTITPGDIIKSVTSLPKLVQGPDNSGTIISTPLVLVHDHGPPRLYFQKYYYHEKKILDHMLARLTSEIEAPGPGVIRTILKEISSERPLTAGGAPVKLNPEQKLAAVLALMKNLVIISGGPGTGKTSVIVTITRALARMGIPPERIKISAPTGRAAGKISDTIQKAMDGIRGPSDFDTALSFLEGETIHRMLRYSPSRKRFLRDAGNPVPADAVIIDEVSMTDVALLSALMDAVPPAARLILIGDRDQLPSIESGSVLADIIPDDKNISFSGKVLSCVTGFEGGISGNTAPDDNRPFTDRIVILHESYRSGSAVSAFADAVNRQDPSGIDSIPLLSAEVFNGPGDKTMKDIMRPGVIIIEAKKAGTGSGNDLALILSAWIGAVFPAEGSWYFEALDRLEKTLYRGGHEADGLCNEISGVIEASRILCSYKSGPSGTRRVNSIISAIIAGKPGPHHTGRGYICGMPVIIMANDYAKGLFNGEVGFILRHGGSYIGVFKKPGGPVFYPVESLPHHEPAFAVTVHKSQGSEYDRVLILPGGSDTGSLTKEILYTAVTRARETAVIYSNADELKTIMGGKIIRESGLKHAFHNTDRRGQ